MQARAAATRATAVVLWLLVCASAGSGFAALARVGAADGARPAAAGAEPGIGGFAELYVAAFLEDPAAAVRAFNPAAPSVEGIGRGERHVARVATVAVAPAGEGAWTATVAAEVLVAAEGGYRRDGLRWFRVGVARSAEGYVAASLPGEFPPPAAPPPASATSKLPPADGRLGRLVEGFFASFLAGAPGLDRYLSADALIAPANPPIATSVKLEGLRLEAGGPNGRARAATAQVRIVDRTGRPLVYQYVLRLTALDGTWRVDALMPPALPLAGATTP